MIKTTRVVVKLMLCAVLALGLMTGCSTGNGQTESASEQGASIPDTTATISSLNPVLTVEAIEVVSDPEVLTENTNDPYSLLDPEVLDLTEINRDQYNALYHAVENLEPSFDTSSFNLSRIQLLNLIGSLDVNFRLFYLKSFDVSKDGRTATFSYSGSREDILRDTETYHARLGHLIYDIAPEGNSDLQKLAALYDAVCRMSNYTSDTQNVSTWSPYSIVNNGEGLCVGYAMLMKYLLNQCGITAEFASNAGHAWNIVQINGKWYHCDATYGAGESGDTMNILSPMLMDDTLRMQSLQTSPIVMNMSQQPPACDDESFNAYADVGWCYALDIDGAKVYFSGQNGIECMNLDCTGRKTFIDGVSASQMVFFNGNLYYINTNDGYLYEAGGDALPQLLDGGGAIMQLALKNARLTYNYEYETVIQTIDLLPGAEQAALAAQPYAMSDAEVSRGSSFSFNIRFSKPVNPLSRWSELVYLRDAEENTIPLSFQLNSDGTVLTVRSKDCLADAGSVSLLISDGIVAADGTPMASPCRVNVSIRSKAE